MIARILIAAVITTTTLTGVAWQRASGDDPRPNLLLFSDSVNCEPCRLFEADYKRSPGFANELKRLFRCYPSYSPTEHPDAFRQYKINGVPTFLVTDGAGRELHRVVGYSNPKSLIDELRHKCPGGVCPPALPPANAPPANHGTPDPQSQRLESANAALQQQLDEMRLALELSRDALRATPPRPQPPPAIVPPTQQAPPIVPPAISPDSVIPGITGINTPTPPPDVPAISPEILSPPAESHNTAGKWLAVLGWLGRTGLAIAAPEVAIPGTIALTAIGAGLTWIRHRSPDQQQHHPETTKKKITENIPFPRRLDEAREHRDIRGHVERRCPEFDTAVGRVVQDEMELSRQLGTADDNRTLKDFWERVRKRVDTLMPPSIREYLE